MLYYSLFPPCAVQMVNLSPTEESYFESLCSLRFASQVNQCELGKPKRQLKDASSEPCTAGVSADKDKTAVSARQVASGLRKPKERERAN
jgi:hypothetical protein